MINTIRNRLFASASTPVIAPFTVFQSTGMLMARPVPVQVSLEDPTLIAREGYVLFTVMPRASEGGESQFEKDKKVSVKLRAKQIGQLIGWRMGPVGTGNTFNLRNGGMSSLNVTAYQSGSSPVTIELKPIPEEQEEPMLKLTVTPKEGSPVSMSIAVGEMKALQVLLESSLPSLYGWTGKTLMPKSFGTSGASPAATTKSPEEFFKQFAATG
jgi:hypothetical protein